MKIKLVLHIKIHVDGAKTKGNGRNSVEYLPDKRIIQATIGRQVITNTTQNTINKYESEDDSKSSCGFLRDGHQQSSSKTSRF